MKSTIEIVSETMLVVFIAIIILTPVAWGIISLTGYIVKMLWR